MSLPTDDKLRKRLRIFDGFDKYFPDAIAAIAELSVISSEKHSPGEPLHWAKDKSTDQYGSMRRHQLDMAKDGELARDYENGGVLHATEVAWRACAFLQTLADRGHNIFAEPQEDYMRGSARAAMSATEQEIRKEAEVNGRDPQWVIFDECSMLKPDQLAEAVAAEERVARYDWKQGACKLRAEDFPKYPSQGVDVPPFIVDYPHAESDYQIEIEKPDPEVDDNGNWIVQAMHKGTHNLHYFGPYTLEHAYQFARKNQDEYNIVIVGDK